MDYGARKDSVRDLEGNLWSSELVNLDSRQS
jgi:hypothetical protein